MASTTGVRRPLTAGVDIGASKVLAVLLDERREEVGRVRLSSSGGATGVVTSAVDAVTRLVEHTGATADELIGVGVGVPGLVQRDSGDVSHAVNLGVDGTGLSLGLEVADRLGVPVVVENDVNAAALGVARLLDLEDADLAFLSIGTGLAAGLVSGGRVRHGSRGAAGEIGHVPVDPAGPLCRCGQRGCLETLASGSAIAAQWPVTDGVAPSSALFAAAATGDLRAVSIRDTFAAHVAAAIRLLVLTCDVERVVLGGGVADLGPALLDAVAAALHRQSTESPFLAALELPSRVAITPTGSAPAAVGAALCAMGAHSSGRTFPTPDVDGRAPAVPWA